MPATFSYTAWEDHLTNSGMSWSQVVVPTYGPVKFFELARPGPQLSFADNTHRCERQFVVWPYEDLWAFCAWQLGWSYLDPLYNSTGAGVFRVTPQALPVKNARTQKPLAYATAVTRTEGWMPDGFQFPVLGAAEETWGGTYALGKATIAYTTVVPPLRLDEHMTRHPESNHPDEGGLQRAIVRTMAPSAKHVQFPAGAMRWQGVGLSRHAEVSSQPFGRMVPFADVVYMWQQVPAIPEVVLTAVGKVNSTWFDQGQFPPQTLLITSIEIQPGRQVTGERMFNISYRMRNLQGNRARPVLGDILAAPIPDALSGVNPTQGHNYFLRFWQEDQALEPTIEFVWDQPYSVVRSGSSQAKVPVFESLHFPDLFRGPFILNNWVL